MVFVAMVSQHTEWEGKKEAIKMEEVIAVWEQEPDKDICKDGDDIWTWLFHQRDDKRHKGVVDTAEANGS